jgi:predicted RNase H-like HicB family nuclease
MKRRTYRILLNKEPEGGYTVNVPALPGCMTYGENIDEAIAMAKEAIELYIEAWKLIMNLYRMSPTPWNTRLLSIVKYEQSSLLNL